MIIENKTKRVPLKKREREMLTWSALYFYMYIFLHAGKKKNNSQICTRRCSKCDSLV